MANTRTPTSRKPRTEARAASRPSAEQVADEPDVTEAEAQEIEAEGHYVPAELCGEEVLIVPPSAWRTSWQRLLNEGQLDAFAEKVLHPDDYELYEELDPTIVEFLEFTANAAQRSGESLGKSRGPAPSSRRTRRR
ncbi:hypothetical protein [Streptomyces bangladeshensis]|uniref:Tail assembly chaperone n=1 Tax=Streptomyces bangladeshensis TaxID=295352 RepID=A0ABP5N7A0_9ACTN